VHYRGQKKNDTSSFQIFFEKQVKSDRKTGIFIKNPVFDRITFFYIVITKKLITENI